MAERTLDRLLRLVVRSVETVTNFGAFRTPSIRGHPRSNHPLIGVGVVVRFGSDRKGWRCGRPNAR